MDGAAGVEGGTGWRFVAERAALRSAAMAEVMARELGSLGLTAAAMVISNSVSWTRTESWTWQISNTGSRWTWVQLFLAVAKGTAEKTPTSASRLGDVGVIP
ncbi:hypothetical protein M0R45_010473 [Rubus argutus]|uniref:Uncharacterized protein n=1 Tax=Rubus argutus TaxID=59490 RepID=A0AAW1Y760_RUBAR